jgi:aconitate hydratase
MGILPLQFKKGDNADSLGLTGKESYDILGIENMEPNGEFFVKATDEKGDEVQFQVISRLDSNVEMEYYRNGGILHKFLRDTLKKK